MPGVPPIPPQRLARPRDITQISALMRASVLEIFPRFYVPDQTASERAARAEGFTTLALMATLPGEQLYRAFGFRETARPLLTLDDGVQVQGVAMQRAISSAT